MSSVPESPRDPEPTESETRPESHEISASGSSEIAEATDVARAELTETMPPDNLPKLPPGIPVADGMASQPAEAEPPAGLRSPQEPDLPGTKDPNPLKSHHESDNIGGITQFQRACDDPEVGERDTGGSGERIGGSESGIGGSGERNGGSGERNGGSETSEATPFLASRERRSEGRVLDSWSHAIGGVESGARGAAGGARSEQDGGWASGEIGRFVQSLLPRNPEVVFAPLKENWRSITVLAAAVSGAAILLAVSLSLLLVPSEDYSVAVQSIDTELLDTPASFNLSWKGYTTYLQQLESLQQHVGQPSLPFHVLPRGPHGFIPFTAYRLTSRSFASVGFGAHFLKDHLGTVECLWQGSKLELKGRSTVIYTNQRRESDYDTIVIKCEFEESTGEAGGDLFLTISQEPFLALRESTSIEHTIIPPEFDSLPHLVTACAVRLGREVEARAVAEWVSYHWHLGVTKFRLYDSGSMDNSLATVLDGFLRNDSLQVIPTRHLSFYNIEYDEYSLSAHDCLYSTHFTSRWVTVLPPDSYLFLAPPATLPTFLAHYSDRPWLTFGAHEWSIEKCREGIPWENATTEEWVGKRDTSPFVVEWLVYRMRLAVCDWGSEDEDREKCLGSKGRRLHFTNPRKAGVLDYNEVRETGDNGEHVAYSDMHRNIYPELHERSVFARICSEVGQVVDSNKWVKDVSAADFAKQLRKSPPPAASYGFASASEQV